MRKNIILLGAGSHARVVLDALRAEGLGRRILGAVDLYDNPRLSGADLDGIPVLGTLTDLGRLFRRGARVYVPAIGDNRLRQASCGTAREAGLRARGAAHPRAILSAGARIGPGAVLCAGVAVNPGARIDAGAILNTGCIIEHDCAIGGYAHIAPGARLAGNVAVGARAWVGLGASIREGIRIGADAVVGAGAVVIRNVPAGVTVAGIPAKPLQK